MFPRLAHLPVVVSPRRLVHLPVVNLHLPVAAVHLAEAEVLLAVLPAEVVAVRPDQARRLAGHSRRLDRRMGRR